MQAYFMRLAQEDGDYIPLEVPTERFQEAIKGLYAIQIDGFNVTVPFKERILEHLQALTHEARTIGAVNTVVKLIDGSYLGHNTDALGFLRALEGGFKGKTLKGSSVLLIGAGGAARAVSLALLRGGPERFVLTNRTFEQAQVLGSRLKTLFPQATLETCPLGELRNPKFLQEFDWMVQTTSAEMKGERLSVCFPRRLTRLACVIDLIYHPLLTPFLKAAKKAGAQTQNGLPTLLFQGLEAFRLFFGKKVKKKPAQLLEALEKGIGEAF
jgi:shikimate dehydrogenase